MTRLGRWHQVLSFVIPCFGMILGFELGYSAGREYALDEYVDSETDSVESGLTPTLAAWEDYFQYTKWLFLAILFWLVMSFAWAIFHRGKLDVLAKLTWVAALTALVSCCLQFAGVSFDFWSVSYSRDSLVGRIVAVSTPAYYLATLGFAFGFVLIALSGRK